MLTIGQLARLGGTTVRAIRHYHQTGLLPEPARQANGYRQYRASDLDRLIRIRQLGELGLALPDIRRLIAATPEDRRDALRTLDNQYEAQQAILAERRARLATLLATPGDPASPDVYRTPAASLRALGAPDEIIALEESMFRAIRTVSPDTNWPGIDAALADLGIDPAPGRVLADLMRRMVAVAGLAPDDPDVLELVDDYAAFLRETWPELIAVARDAPDDAMTTWAVTDLMDEHLTPTQVSVIHQMITAVFGDTSGAAPVPDGHRFADPSR